MEQVKIGEGLYDRLLAEADKHQNVSMAAQADRGSIPAAKPNNGKGALGLIGGTLGGIVGGIAGGPMGAIQGARAGKGVGDSVASATDKPTGGPQASAGDSSGGSSLGAIFDQLKGAFNSGKSGQSGELTPATGEAAGLMETKGGGLI